jgi:hypothetical protein
MSSATDLNLLDLGLTEVPEDIAQRSGNVVTSLNMTENALRLVSWRSALARFRTGRRTRAA